MENQCHVYHIKANAQSDIKVKKRVKSANEPSEPLGWRLSPIVMQHDGRTCARTERDISGQDSSVAKPLKLSKGTCISFVLQCIMWSSLFELNHTLVLVRRRHGLKVGRWDSRFKSYSLPVDGFVFSGPEFNSFTFCINWSTHNTMTLGKGFIYLVLQYLLVGSIPRFYI